jgi:hypothetical protein
MLIIFEIHLSSGFVSLYFFKTSLTMMDLLHIITLLFCAHFVLTRAHPEKTSQSVTHLQIAYRPSTLNISFFGDGLPEKNMDPVGMSIPY